ncbi:MAG TPA: ligase-associated DNA damage response endonuclease PdeM [Chitinophagaceae bacterium]|nr:ligase-associated DNA damage response endonuclease PdeM [Chitinophagaceae bacterium]
MQYLHPYQVRGNRFCLSPERCLFWEEEKALIIADMHLGKTGHFRRSGIPVPQHIYRADLQRLVTQLYYFRAERLIIVGDLTHSSANRELDLFLRWRKDFSALRIDLVKGNHDILAEDWYRQAEIVMCNNLEIGEFAFCHDSENRKKGHYHFSGHVHPGVTLKGKAQQSMRLPCFYFAKDFCILPAFSHFTGTYSVQPAKGETVFAILRNRIMQVA